jgi:drug/metabolite transporter (DMT)-like permease
MSGESVDDRFQTPRTHGWRCKASLRRTSERVVIPVLLAFGSSVSWGVADFVGGLKSRQLPLLNVLVASQASGLVCITTIVVVRGQGFPSGDFWIFAMLSAVAGVVGLASFYRGLAVGNMAVVAPISATSAVVPLVIGVATGDRPTGVQSAGLAFALVGVVLASREEVGAADEGRGWIARGAGLAVLSALGFGFFFAAMDRASDADVFWAIFVNRVTGVTLLLGAALALRPPIEVRRTDLAVLASIGVLDITANALFAFASTEGLISLVAVIGSLYPLTTVALARIVLGERPHAVAQLGVAVALFGVVLIAAG